MIVLSHPTGNAFVRETARALFYGGVLEEFWTCVNWNENSVADRLSPPFLRKQLRRRTHSPELQPLIRTRPLRELGRLCTGRLNVRCLIGHERGVFSVDAIYRDLDRAVGRRVRGMPGVKGVYAYEDGAAATFEAARERGLRTFYDLPIAYWETSRRLLEEEAERWPEWEPTLGGTRDSDAKLERKSLELELADVVVCPSRFVLETLPAAARRDKRCLVSEFGSPPITSGSGAVRPADGPLRVLFAGSMSQRKGLADLFAACRLLRRRDVELVVLGSLVAPLDFYRTHGVEFRYEPPRPHSAVLELMRTCHVLVLPSIVEGRALVQQEALSCGLPLIVTPNAGGDDLVEEGVTGFLVPIRDAAAIAAKMDWFADHRDQLPGMAEAAQKKAGEYTWESYGTRILHSVRESLSQR